MICENCNCEHDGSYGSGRFCSAHCKSVWIGKTSYQTMKKHGTHKSNWNKVRIRNKKPYGTWKCARCNLIFETRAELRTHNHEIHPIQKGSSWNKGLTKETDERVAKYVNTHKARGYVSPFKGKHLSEEHKRKTSQSMKRFYKEHPELVPYKLHHSSKESYPERYFTKVFYKENIQGYIKEYNVSGYFLDFAFIEDKIDLEIDGSQYYVDLKIIEHDKIRTETLTKLGWIVIRIDWRAWKKLSKEERYMYIKNLKNKVYKSIKL